VNSGGVSSSPFYSTSTHKPECPDGSPASYRSNDHAVAEPALVDQPHTIREVPFSDADDWADDHLKVDDKTSP